MDYAQMKEHENFYRLTPLNLKKFCTDDTINAILSKIFEKYSASPDLSHPDLSTKPDLSTLFLEMKMWQIGYLEDFRKQNAKLNTLSGDWPLEFHRKIESKSRLRIFLCSLFCRIILELLFHWKINSFYTDLVHFTKCFSIFVSFFLVLKIN